jgi:hypothetical protein
MSVRKMVNFHLVLETARDEIHGLRVQGNLSGEEDQVAMPDSLGVRSDGGRSLFGGDDASVHGVLLKLKFY